MSELLTFDNPAAVTFKVSRETRTITGLALPFGEVGDNGRGRFMFTAGTLRWDKVLLLNGHDWDQILGVVDLEETAEGLAMSARVAATARGDEVLALAEMGAIDGLSVGLAEAFDYEERDGVMHAVSGTVREVSTTPIPAFTNAAIRSVAASAAAPEEGTPAMTDTVTDPAAFAALAEQVTELAEQVTELQTFTTDQAPGHVTLQVTEEPIYRFAGPERAPSGFDFAEDLLAGAKGDAAALARVQAFANPLLTGAGPTFVSTTDVAANSPAAYRPDLFIGQAPTPPSPLYDFFHKGPLSDNRPFFHTKLDRAGTTVAVAPHTEGVDPTDTTIKVVSGATVTPSAVSGKVHITREVGDRGGDPNVSAMIWGEFERSWRMALETRTAALLASVAAAVAALTGTIPAGANGAVAGLAIERGLIGLQFLADGSRFTRGFGHVDLYTELGTYENGDGEKRYPIINPANRSGISGDQFAFLEIAGWRFTPTASLGGTSSTASNSWVADPAAVHAWNSGLQKLDKLQERVEGWDIGAFGYWAGLVHDSTGLRKIAYDQAA